ncbi:hypothetical protein RF11_03047 [Thelohanellus kitauei]|uniref:Alpha-soluble NSF attachment protein n=1 Tax=Thelohanellus kitauei TaxID=669202 RepID=A0A0C2N4L3_THEKT|nr:hypothetical protein RF11_03047 [Thelohanellus kitauei]
MEYRAVERTRSLVEVREEINDLIRLGESYKDSKMYEEAGAVYYEAARFIEGYFRHFETAQEKFEESARCFLKVNSNIVYTVYHKIIDLMVKDIIELMLKDNKLNIAIQDCFIFGHKFGTVYRDEEKREAFYKRGDEIRVVHGKSHECAQKTFNLSEYEQNVPKAFLDYDKFNTKIDLPVFGIITFTSVCRNCIDIYAQLCDFIKDKHREDAETEPEDEQNENNEMNEQKEEKKIETNKE